MSAIRIENTVPEYLYTVSAAASSIAPLPVSSRPFPLVALLVGLALLAARAPEADVVPVTEIQPINDSQSDLTLTEVVGRFEQNLGASRKKEAYRLGKLVMELSERHQLSPSLILAVIESESSFRPEVVSKAGAVGMMQLLPDTAKEMALKYRVRSYHDESDLSNPAINMRLGVAYLAHLRHQFGTSLHYLAAYNVGPTALRRRLREGRYELGSLDAYVRIIHERARNLRGDRITHKMRGAMREEALMAASL